MFKFILVTLLYFSWKNIILYLIDKIKWEIARAKKQKINKKIDPNELTYRQKVKKYQNYAFNEGKQKTKFYIIYLIGLIITLIATALTSLNSFVYLFILICLFIPFFIDYYLFQSFKTVIEKRDKIIDRMLNLKFARMGRVQNKGEMLDISKELEILEWEDAYTPVKLRMTIPVNFDPLQSESFLEQFNVMFGKTRAWAPDEEDKDYPGWQYEAGAVTLKAIEALPNMANWHEGYLLNDHCAWSFFPLAIGTQGGVMMKDPHTGEDVHVLGFDLAGETPKLAKKLGFYCGPELQSGVSPQVLVVGATGGGKALGLNTEIYEE